MNKHDMQLMKRITYDMIQRIALNHSTGDTEHHLQRAAEAFVEATDQLQLAIEHLKPTEQS